MLTSETIWKIMEDLENEEVENADNKEWSELKWNPCKINEDTWEIEVSFTCKRENIDSVISTLSDFLNSLK